MLWRHAAIPVLLGALLLLPVAGALADLPLEWRVGLLETRRYTISVKGVAEGEIEARLYGDEGPGGKRRLRAVYDLARKASAVPGQEQIGRIRIEVLFDPKSFELLERKDTFSVGDSEGRVTYSRTPEGILLRSESASEGIQRPAEEKSIAYDLAGPLIDESIFVYYARALPLEGGHTFELSTVNPRREDVDRIKGLVRSPVELTWNGERVQAYPVETSTPLGVATYYVRADDAHTLVRYVSVGGDVYELQPEAAPLPPKDE